MTADLTKRTFGALQFLPQNCEMKKCLITQQG